MDEHPAPVNDAASIAQSATVLAQEAHGHPDPEQALRDLNTLVTSAESYLSELEGTIAPR